MTLDSHNLPPNIARCMPTAPGMVPPAAIAHAAASATDESDLWRELSKWLTAWGYWTRTHEHISAEHRPAHGWQIHLHEARGNPLLLDVLLLRNDGRYLEFELKRRGGKWNGKHQQILCESHGKAKYETLEDAQVGIMAWENECKTPN